MAKNVIMPKFGMDQETGTVVRWLKQPGDAVTKGEPLLEVETDKVNMEVEAPASGFLTAVSAAPGVAVPIGQVIAVIAGAEERAAVAAAPPEPAARKATPVAANVARAHGVPLDALPADAGPRITRRDVESYLAGQAAAPAAVTAAVTPDGKVAAVPAARRLAREQGIALTALRGTGPAGRIQSRDVLAAVTTADAAPAPAAAPPTRRGSTVPLSSMRRTIARRLTQSAQDVPQFTVTMQVNLRRPLALVDELRAIPGDGPRPTVTAVLVRACAEALRRVPQVNGSFQDDAITLWDDVNIGVAVAVDDGLIVPVVRAADRLRLAELAAALEWLSQRARAGQLTPDDVQEGTFTISNLGMYGVDAFTAIINPPQAAILAVGRAVKQVVVLADDRTSVEPLASFTLTADHRILDGALAARFLGEVKRLVEHPALMI